MSERDANAIMTDEIEAQAAEIERLRAMLDNAAEMATLSCQLIEQSDLQEAAGWDCLYVHSENLIAAMFAALAQEAQTNE